MLDVVNLDLGLAVNENAAGVVFLSTLLRVKVRLVENDAELFAFGYLRGGLDKFAVVIDCLDGSLDVVTLELGRVVL